MQFVAGETPDDLVHALAEMRQFGIGGITVFASGALALLPLLGGGYQGLVCCADPAAAACLLAWLRARRLGHCCCR